MLICIEVDSTVYSILDTSIITPHTEYWLRCSRAYNKDVIAEMLKTQKIVGLDIKSKDYIDYNIMYKDSDDSYLVDLYKNTYSHYLILANSNRLYVYNYNTGKKLGEINLIEHLPTYNITLGNCFIMVDYILDISNDLLGRLVYHIKEQDKGIELEDKAFKLMFSYDKNENIIKSLELPVSLDYAQNLISKVGIDGFINTKDAYQVLDDYLSVKIRVKDTFDNYVVKDAIYCFGFENGKYIKKCIYKRKG
jgi:hypothetical protein